MEKIDRKDIDYSKLTILKEWSATRPSSVFTDGDNVYKLFMHNDRSELKRIEKRVSILSTDDISDYTILPKTEIYDNGQFSGYAQDYLPDSKSLYSYRGCLSEDLPNFIWLASASSMTLDLIHSDYRLIRMCDMNFSNILISKDQIPYFIDFDEIKVGPISPSVITSKLSAYLNKKGFDVYSLADNNCKANFRLLDNIAFMIFFFNIFFDRDFFKITIDEYDEMSEKFSTLKNLRDMFLDIQNLKDIKGMDYLYERVDPKDFPEGILESDKVLDFFEDFNDRKERRF